ncbi:MAG: hypothetical protein M1514_03810 [Patescibacteria group bacterium]|nr:hypothetical protein [Patescibacteria group bacterium]
MRRESDPLKEYLINGGKILTGSDLVDLPEKKLLNYGRQIGRIIATHPETMLQYTPEDLVKIMKDGRAVVVVDPQDESLCYAFAQIYPWISEDQRGRQVVGATEFRSWISNRPYQGIFALRGAIALSQQRFPGIPVYAVVEANNQKAQERLLSEGAELLLEVPNTIKVVLGEGQARVNIFALKTRD